MIFRIHRIKIYSQFPDEIENGIIRFAEVVFPRLLTPDS